MADLDAASLDDVTDFFRTWYGPANATLVIAGDVSEELAIERARHWFGDIEGAVPPEPPRVPTRVPEAARAVLVDDVTVPRVYLAWPAPSFTQDGFEAGDVLASLLADGRSSRLYDSLVYDRRVAADVSAYLWPTEMTGVAWIVATARPGVNAATLEGEMRRVIDEVRADGPSDAELEGARNRARRQLVQQLDSVGPRADLIAHAAVYRDDPNYVNSVFRAYAGVTAEDVRSVAERIFRTDDGVTLHVVPGGSA
jgi:zinc protease